jgi:hypothetical protein
MYGNNIFSVKSAYHLVKEVEQSGQLEESIWLGIVKFGEFYGNYPSKLQKRILCGGLATIFF